MSLDLLDMANPHTIKADISTTLSGHHVPMARYMILPAYAAEPS